MPVWMGVGVVTPFPAVVVVLVVVVVVGVVVVVVVVPPDITPTQT
jgi:hypothetical protein